jgi:hypothetical protein
MALSYNEEQFHWTAHAASYEARRGFTRAEVERAIQDSVWTLNERGKLECRADLPFHAVWNGNSYRTKQVRPVFVVEERIITIITVYTYFF